MELQDILGQLNGNDNLVTYGSTSMGEINDWLPTLLPRFDHNLVGGFPASGRVSEVAGKASSGKSSLMGLVIKNLQKMGGITVYYDVEGTQDASRLEELGADPSQVLTLKPKRLKDGTMEELSVETIGKSIVETLAKIHSADPSRVVLFVWDTVAMTNSSMQAEGELGQQLVGQQARALTVVGRKIQVNLIANNGMLIALNQARDDFNAPNPRYAQLKTVGGRGWEHLLSTRLTLQRASSLKAKSTDTQPIGQISRVKVVKSKVGENWGSDFQAGIVGKWGYDLELNLVLEGQDEGIISTGRSVKYVDENGEVLLGGRNTMDLVEKLKQPENNEIRDRLWQQLIKKFFPQCYPPLFNTTLIMYEDQFPMIAGMREYYIHQQQALEPKYQDYNYKHFMQEYSNGNLPDQLVKEVKGVLD